MEGPTMRGGPEFNSSMASKVEISEIRQATPLSLETVYSLGLANPEIKKAALCLFELAKKIVESGNTYDLVVSDDTSGRIVSLFVKKILDGVQEKRGLQRTNIRFVASGRHNNLDTFEDIKDIVKKASGQRTLLVTEYIDSGNSVIKLVKVLQSTGTAFDVAALSTKGYGKANVESYLSEEKPDASLLYGEIGIIGLASFYGYEAKELSGVTKRTDSAIPQKNIKDYFYPEEKIRIQNKINKTREDIDKLANASLRCLGF